MSLVFAAVAPHSPILLPNIGKEQSNQLQKTIDALTELERLLYTTQPEVIIILSPHASYFEEVFSIISDENLTASFEQFGDVTEQQTWRGIPALAAYITNQAQKEQLPVKSVTDHTLDYSSATILHFLCKNLPDIQVLPIGFSGLAPKQHLNFGALINDIISSHDKRIAVIASGNLSHALSDKSPVAMHPDGKKFDDMIVELLETRNTIGISQIDSKMIKNAQECAYRSVLIMLGILQHMNYSFKNLSYEAPLGVGYLVGYFDT